MKISKKNKLLFWPITFGAIWLLFADFSYKPDNLSSIQKAVVLIDKNGNDWTLTRLDLYSRDSEFFYIKNARSSDGTKEVKSGSIDEIDKIILEERERVRLRIIFNIMRSENLNRIRKEKNCYVFFEKGGRFFNRGNVYVYATNEKLWNPISGDDGWINKPYNFEKIDNHWYKARQ